MISLYLKANNGSLYDEIRYVFLFGRTIYNVYYEYVSFGNKCNSMLCEKTDWKNLKSSKIKGEKSLINTWFSWVEFGEGKKKNNVLSKHSVL